MHPPSYLLENVVWTWKRRLAIQGIPSHSVSLNYQVLKGEDFSTSYSSVHDCKTDDGISCISTRVSNTLHRLSPCFCPLEALNSKQYFWTVFWTKKGKLYTSPFLSFVTLLPHGKASKQPLAGRKSCCQLNQRDFYIQKLYSIGINQLTMTL